MDRWTGLIVALQKINLRHRKRNPREVSYTAATLKITLRNYILYIYGGRGMREMREEGTLSSTTEEESPPSDDTGRGEEE